MSHNLTEKQQKIVNFLISFTSKHGYPPTVREIAKHLNTPYTRTIEHHLKKLEEKGIIKRDRGVSRGIKLSNPGIPVPLVGRITAGKPVLATENIEDYITIDPSLLKPGTCFLLRIRGDSMINAGIFDQDLILVRKQPTAENNDIIVALIDETETTVKRLKIRKDKIILEPENPNYKPIIIKDPENLTIIGKVIAVIRKID